MHRAAERLNHRFVQALRIRLLRAWRQHIHATDKFLCEWSEADILLTKGCTNGGRRAYDVRFASEHRDRTHRVAALLATALQSDVCYTKPTMLQHYNVANKWNRRFDKRRLPWVELYIGKTLQP